MRGILWNVAQKLEGILDGILMEFHMLILEDKNQIQKSMYIPWYFSSSLYSSCISSSGVVIFLVKFVEDLNQIRTDRQTVELRISWEGVLNHTWISPWTQKGILLCEMDPRKRSVTYVFMNDETSV